VLAGHADRDVRGLQRLSERRHVPATYTYLLTYICILADTKRRVLGGVLGGHADRDVRGLQRLAERRHVSATYTCMYISAELYMQTC